MSASEQGQQPEPAEQSAQPEQPEQPVRRDRSEAEWQRKRRLARIFGDVLPDTTDDERGPGERAERSESASERWLRSQVPPHHGR